MGILKEKQEEEKKEIDSAVTLADRINHAFAAGMLTALQEFEKWLTIRAECQQGDAAREAADILQECKDRLAAVIP